MSESSEKGSKKGSKKDSENRASVSASFRVGDFVGNDYELLKELGRGGMGVVFEARHRFIGQPVALKVLYPHLLTEENWQRFVREARALGRLDHPGIVKIFNCGIDAERAAPFYVMELIEGDSLSDLVDVRGALPEELAIKAAIEAAKALHFAHGMGVVHRDVKPSNFILPHSASRSSLNLKVLDFGIAALSSDRLSSKEKQKLTATGQIFGTPYYMSPEVVTGQAASPLSDVYSLGCTLFEMLSGQVPYKGESIFETLGMHMSAPLPSLSETSGHEFSSELELLVARALAKSPRERYSSMQMFAVDLERYLDCRPVYGTGIKSEGFADLGKTVENNDSDVELLSRMKTGLLILLTMVCLSLLGLVTYYFVKPARPEAAPPVDVTFEAKTGETSMVSLLSRKIEVTREGFTGSKRISAEDRALISRGYEISRTKKSIKYQFPNSRIGEIWLPGGAREAWKTMSIPVNSGGKWEFIIFGSTPREYIAGLKPDSFDLQLRFERVSDFYPAIKCVKDWTALKQIRLERMVLDKDIMALDDLPSSREFSVAHCVINFPLLNCQQIHNARVIYFNSVRGQEFTNFLAKLSQLDKLEGLSLSTLSLSEEDIDSLTRAKQLKCVCIEKTDISPEQLAKLMSLPGLRALKVRDCLYSPKDILQALENCPNRRNLKLTLNIPNLSAKKISKLMELKHKIDEPAFSWNKADMAAVRRKVFELELYERESIKLDGDRGYFSLSEL
ncbi:MAG: serine/threonine protein kinase [Candidatus Obscuribacterales bacterium]|nr:serine/threonine protein kinase [Candidatus Obscuribacterales bacterium]